MVKLGTDAGSSESVGGGDAFYVYSVWTENYFSGFLEERVVTML